MLNDISLITTVFNEEKSIADFLESYRAQTVHADEFVIVDGGSGDATAAIISGIAAASPELGIRLIVDPTCSRKVTPGAIAAGRNRAIREARHELIAVTDAGCMLAPQWLEELLKPFCDPHVEVVAGWYEAKIDVPFQRVYAAVAMPALETLDPERFLPSSRSIAFRKRCWQAVSGYPTMTYTAEDTRFDLDLKKQGFRFAFAPRAVVFWRCPETLAEALQKHYRYAYDDGQCRQLLGFYLAKNLLLLLPLTFLLDARRRKHFKFAYALLLVSQWGYARGLLAGFLTPLRTERAGR